MKNKYQYTYKCLGCNKIHHSNKFYKYGWLCSECAKNIKLTVKCYKCGNDVQISWNSYQQKYPKDEYQCKECFIKGQKENGINRWKDVSKEKRQEYIKPCRDSLKVKMENMTDEEKKAIYKKRSNSLKNNLSKLSDEEKRLKVLPANLGNQKKFKTLSKSKIDELMKPIHDGYWNWFNNLSLENKLIHNKNISKSLLEYFNDRSYDEFLTMEKNKVINWNAKPNNEKLQNITKTEMMFKNILDENKIDYEFQYYNTKIHPKFKELFIYNQNYDTEFISPYHKWDFMVKIFDKHIFIDIDGSIHDFTYYSPVKKQISFYDLQRLYKNDYNDSYIVLCLNDDINNKTLVVDLKHNVRLSMKIFIDRLKHERIKLKELHELLKN